MIFNEPSYNSLNASALRFHYSAWDLLIEVIGNCDSFHRDSTDESQVTWNLERQEYLSKSLYDLQAIFTYIAQSSELSLRAKICEVSPYLLLLNTENKFKHTVGKVDFTELRTVDAVDLPLVVNAVCANTLSQDFVNIYNDVRSLRNKIMHLGLLPNRKFDVDEILKLLVDQYWHLWSGKSFFPRWIEHSTRKRSAHFFDYKNYTEYTDVLFSIPVLTPHLTKSDFKRIFGFEKSKRRYICYDCCSAGCLERHSDLSLFPTAVLVDKENVYCAVCEKTYPFDRVKCADSSCKGNVVFSDDHYSPVCLTCGGSQ
jgi:hypothetical protein